MVSRLWENLDDEFRIYLKNICTPDEYDAASITDRGQLFRQFQEQRFSKDDAESSHLKGSVQSETNGSGNRDKSIERPMKKHKPNATEVTVQSRDNGDIENETNVSCNSYRNINRPLKTHTSNAAQVEFHTSVNGDIDLSDRGCGRSSGDEGDSDGNGEGDGDSDTDSTTSRTITSKHASQDKTTLEEEIVDLCESASDSDSDDASYFVYDSDSSAMCASTKNDANQVKTKTSSSLIVTPLPSDEWKFARFLKGNGECVMERSQAHKDGLKVMNYSSCDDDSCDYRSNVTSRPNVQKSQSLVSDCIYMV